MLVEGTPVGVRDRLNGRWRGIDSKGVGEKDCAGSHLTLRFGPELRHGAGSEEGVNDVVRGKG